MDTETSTTCSSLSLPPPQNPDESKGCFVTLISKYDLRYDGFIYDLSLQNWIICVQNVRCYGTEDRGKNGFHIMPSNKVYEYIVFNGHYLKTVLVKPKGAKISQNVPLISNENLEKPQATMDSDPSLVNGSFYDASNPYAQPQFLSSNFFDPRFMPYGLLNQAPIYNASNPQPMPMPYGLFNQAPMYNASNYQPMSYGLLNQAPLYNAYEFELMPTPTNPSQSFFSDPESFPTLPFSIQPLYGAVASEAAKNFKKYEIWGPSENKNQSDETVRNPYGPIERPYNQYGHIERPFDYSKEIHHYLQRNALLPGYNMTNL